MSKESLRMAKKDTSRRRFQDVENLQKSPPAENCWKLLKICKSHLCLLLFIAQNIFDQPRQWKEFVNQIRNCQFAPTICKCHCLNQNNWLGFLHEPNPAFHLKFYFKLEHFETCRKCQFILNLHNLNWADPHSTINV